MVSNWKNVFEPHVQTTLNRCGSPFPLNLFLNPLSYTMKYWFIGIRLIMDTIFPNQLDLISIIHNFIDQSTMIPHTPQIKGSPKAVLWSNPKIFIPFVPCLTTHWPLNSLNSIPTPHPRTGAKWARSWAYGCTWRVPKKVMVPHTTQVMDDQDLEVIHFSIEI